MKKLLFLSIIYSLINSNIRAANYYISPTGSDTNKGTSQDAPFASLSVAQSKVVAGDIVYILPGSYSVLAGNMMDLTSSTVWDIVFKFATSGTASNPIQYIGIPDNAGNWPVFDFSKISTGKRITGFLIAADYLQFSNIETVGIQVPLSSSNIQSENFRVNGANHCIFNNIAAHDGMGVGFYVTGKSGNNTFINCDAYNNFDVTNVSTNNGGNSDGFGCHVSAGYEGNKFIRCRAWLNSDDGFDFINCYSAATVEYCIAYRNGFSYDGTTYTSRGDGNGFKAGGYGMSNVIAITTVPQHTVTHCIAASNKAYGFYSNHHLGGIKFNHNAAYKNKYNYYMLNRQDATAQGIVDVNGYNHIITNNLSYGTNNVIDKVNVEECSIGGNSFVYNSTSTTWSNDATLTDNSFYSLDPSELTATRKSNGSLPLIYFMQLRDAQSEYGYGTFNNSITFHLFGDSTMSEYGDSTITRGWGQYFDGMFTDNVIVNNWAHTGYTVKNGNNLAWKAARDFINAGDYAIIQYAHNDEKNLTTSDYKKYLTLLTNNIISKNATPILISSVCRNLFSNDTLSDTGNHTIYTALMKHVADSMGVTYLDMRNMTRQLLEGTGTKVAAHELFDGGYTHSNEQGARINARLAITLLYNNNICKDNIIADSLVYMPTLITRLKNSYLNSTTGIDLVPDTNLKLNYKRYNLSGQMVNDSYKGIIIKNRKKILIIR